MRQFLEYGRGLVGDHNHALPHALSLCSDAPLDLYQNIALDQERAFSVSVRLDTFSRARARNREGLMIESRACLLSLPVMAGNPVFAHKATLVKKVTSGKTASDCRAGTWPQLIGMAAAKTVKGIVAHK